MITISTEEDDRALTATLDAWSDAQDLERRLSYEIRVLRGAIVAAQRVARLRKRDATRLREHAEAIRNQIARVRSAATLTRGVLPP